MRGGGRLRGTSAVTSVALAAGLLAGCARGAGAAPAPTAAPTLTPYVVPSTRPAPVTATAVQRDDAVDAVVRFFDALNYGYATNDADPLRTMSTLDCSPCVAWIQEIQRNHDEGRRQVGGFVRLLEMRADGQQQHRFLFRAVLVREAGTITGPTATTPVVGAGKAELVDIVVSVQQSAATGMTSWVLTAMTLAPIDPVATTSGGPP